MQLCDFMKNAIYNIECYKYGYVCTLTKKNIVKIVTAVVINKRREVEGKYNVKGSLFGMMRYNFQYEHLLAVFCCTYRYRTINSLEYAKYCLTMLIYKLDELGIYCIESLRDL